MSVARPAQVVVILGGLDADGRRHIPSPVSTALSLCGWCDVPHRTEDGAPNCPTCKDVVRYVLEITKKGQP